MRAALERRARELGVAHAVRFAGAIDANGDLSNLFKSTDAICVPSRNEPFGITVLEAWAAGKPVVVTNQGGPSEFVEHGVDGFLVYETRHRSAGASTRSSATSTMRAGWASAAA